MNRLSILIALLLFALTFTQEDSDESSSSDITATGSFGASTIEGKIYNQVSFRPELRIKKLGIGLDIKIYIDENGDQITDYSFSNPDFNFLQFRSNLVLRWEYTPGSEIFLVWTQSTTSTTDPEKGIFSSLTDDLFSEKINNIFLMKFTYRFLNK